MDLAILIIVICILVFNVMTFVVSLVLRAKVLGPFLLVVKELAEAIQGFDKFMEQEEAIQNEKLAEARAIRERINEEVKRGRTNPKVS